MDSLSKPISLLLTPDISNIYSAFCLSYVEFFLNQQSEIVHLKKDFLKIMANLPIFDKIGLGVHVVYYSLDFSLSLVF